ncbi:hypothetical protein NPIL_397071, partial [Nephila pilipes]
YVHYCLHVKSQLNQENKICFDVPKLRLIAEFLN